MNPVSRTPPPLDEVPESGTDTPLAFLENAMSGLRCYQAFVTAYDRGFFEACRNEASVEEIAKVTGSVPSIAGPLCEGLMGMGLLRKNSEGRYKVTRHTQDFLLADSPFSQRAALAQMRGYAELSLQLPRILDQGPVTYLRAEQFSETIIPAMAEYSRCGLVQRITSLVSGIPEFQKAHRLLDLGGGHGLYAIAFSRKNPGLEAVVFDLPEVTKATERFIQSYEADRVRTQAGDFFKDPLGQGYDILFSSSNPSGKIPALIPKIHAALNPGGLYINKQMVDEPETDPFLDLEWNLWAFEGMPKQGRRFRFEGSVSLDEYNRCLAESGFVIRECITVEKRAVMTIAQKTGA